MPDILNEGISLRIDDLGNKYSININTNNISGGNFILEGELCGTEIFSQKFEIGESSKRSYNQDLAKTALPEGLIKFKVHRNGHYLATRLIFNAVEPDIQASMRLNKEVYGKYEEATIRITLRDASNNPVKSVIAASLTL